MPPSALTNPRRGPGAPRTGQVTAFDERRGTGIVGADDGRRYFFHCTAIADGSRRILEGTRVVFAVRAGHLGQTEARSILPLAESPSILPLAEPDSG